MKFKSTRGAIADSFTDAFNAGMAADGGLFVPESYPNISEEFEHLSTLSYADLAAYFMHLFADEISLEEWKELSGRAYSSSKFEASDVLEIKKISDDIAVLELFHGPTLAFKDFALQLVGQLYERECRLKGKTYTILGATSGDTGSAAIYGVLGNPAINIFIMYPEGKIAPLQELQITTTGAENVFPIAIKGAFDDVQAVVKQAFTDSTFTKEVNLAAVNSINIARILAQSVYYLYAYLYLKKQLRENTNGNEREDKRQIRFIVPTGNFGNVLSGWLLTKMGIDCSFSLATNANDVLHTLWQTGEYSKKDAKQTHAPSMDIQQASNFERLLYYIFDENAEKVKSVMLDFKQNGTLAIDRNLLPKNITSIAATDVDIEDAICTFYSNYGYILDPHTACVHGALDSHYFSVIVATASPAKFPEVVHKCIGITSTHKILEGLKGREMKFVTLQADTEEIKKYIKDMCKTHKAFIFP